MAIPIILLWPPLMSFSGRPVIPKLTTRWTPNILSLAMDSWVKIDDHKNRMPQPAMYAFYQSLQPKKGTDNTDDSTQESAPALSPDSTSELTSESILESAHLDSFQRPQRVVIWSLFLKIELEKILGWRLGMIPV